MPAAQIPHPDPMGKPAGKPLTEVSDAATESGIAAYDKGVTADPGGGKAALKQERKEELPKSVLDE